MKHEEKSSRWVTAWHCMALAAPDLVKGVLVGIIAVANLHVTTSRRHDVTCRWMMDMLG